MSDPFMDRPPATTIEALDLHLRYVQGQLGDLVRALPQMATKSDIDSLKLEMKGYATKDELRALETKLSAGSVSSTVERFLKAAIWIAAGVGALGALFLLGVDVVHYFDALKAMKGK